jgi:hypothetical protein
MLVAPYKALFIVVYVSVYVIAADFVMECSCLLAFAPCMVPAVALLLAYQQMQAKCSLAVGVSNCGMSLNYTMYVHEWAILELLLVFSRWLQTCRDYEQQQHFNHASCMSTTSRVIRKHARCLSLTQAC